MTTPAGGVQNRHGVTQGDTNGTIVVQITGVPDFTGATVTARIWQATGTVINLTATVVNGVDQYGVACGFATVSLGTWINTATGVWRMKQHVVFQDGTPKSWPEFGYDELIVDIVGT